MEETGTTIHIRMVRCNIVYVKKRQDGVLSHLQCSKIVTAR